MMHADRVVAGGVAALLVLASAPAVAGGDEVCVAEPGLLGTRLADCVDSVTTGGIIHLRSGLHVADGLVISRSMRILGPEDGSAVIVAGLGSVLQPDQLVEFEGGLNDTQVLLDIRGAGTEVEIENAVFRPPTGGGLLEPRYVRGRALVVDQATVTLRSTALVPWSFGGSSAPMPVLRGSMSAERSHVGGVLVRATRGASVVIDSGEFRELLAPSLIGALVHASGAGTKVHVRGRAGFGDVRAAAGTLAVVDGAELLIGAGGDGSSPEFRRLGAVHGGAVYAAAATLHVEAGQFFDGGLPRTRPDWQPTYGGAISGERGALLRIDGGSFIGGRATYGGVIALQGGRLDLLGGSFTGAEAAHGAHVYVGASATMPGDAVIQGATFSGGRASLVAQEREAPESLMHARGGSVAVVGSALEVGSCEFSGNRVSTGAGGAIDLVDASAKVSSTSFTGNLAERGGALSARASNLTIIDSDFASNGGALRGGAIRTVRGALEVLDSTFRDNDGSVGGAIFSATAGSVMISGSSFRGHLAELGGALRVIAGRLDIAGSRFEDNLAGHVAALSGAIEDGGVSVRGAVRIEGSTFVGGTGVRGGAISVNAAELALVDVDIEGSTAALAGGGVFVEQAAQVELDRLTIRGTNAGTTGGGVHLQNVGSAVLRDVAVLDASASSGGGLAMDGIDAFHAIRPVLCGNTAAQGSAWDLRRSGRGGGGGARIDNALIYGADSASTALLRAIDADVSIAQSAFVGGIGPAGSSEVSSVRIERSLIGWLGAAPGSPWVVDSAGALTFTDGAVFLPDWDADLREDPLALGLSADTLVGQPRLRAITLDPVDNPDRRPACDLDRLHEQLHPRPLSQTLFQGYPANESDALVGIFGGPNRIGEPWRTDLDGDGVPWIFDCDDDDPAIGDRLVQYVDDDGDGVGGERWPGDDCHLVPGNVEIGGDCDDQDPTVAAVCGEPIGFYGSRCQVAPGPTLPWAALLAIPWLARRRRIG